EPASTLLWWRSRYGYRPFSFVSQVVPSRSGNLAVSRGMLTTETAPESGTMLTIMIVSVRLPGLEPRKSLPSRRIVNRPSVPRTGSEPGMAGVGDGSGDSPNADGAGPEPWGGGAWVGPTLAVGPEPRPMTSTAAKATTPITPSGSSVRQDRSTLRPPAGDSVMARPGSAAATRPRPPSRTRCPRHTGSPTACAPGRG